MHPERIETVFAWTAFHTLRMSKWLCDGLSWYRAMVSCSERLPFAVYEQHFRAFASFASPDFGWYSLVCAKRLRGCPKARMWGKGYCLWIFIARTRMKTFTPLTQVHVFAECGSALCTPWYHSIPYYKRTRTPQSRFYSSFLRHWFIMSAFGNDLSVWSKQSHTRNSSYALATTVLAVTDALRKSYARFGEKVSSTLAWHIYEACVVSEL